MAETASETDPRAFAWQALLRVEAGDFADAVVGDGLGHTRLGPRDRGLATRLVYGTIAWQAHLDHLLSAFCNRPLRQLDPAVRVVLRLALFQVTRLDRIPPFAAVDTAVELCKQRDRRAAGFVNAVLRKAVRGWRDVPLPDARRDPVGHAAVALSHPRWLVQRWFDELGAADATRLLEANNDVAPTVVRVQLAQGSRADLIDLWQAAGTTAEPTAHAPGGLRLEGAAHTGLPGWTDGRFAFQGEASQLVAPLLGLRPGDRVLDLCAAPGGKALHAAEILGGTGELVAVDIAAAGIDRLRREAQRLRLDGIRAEVADATVWGPPADTPLFDAVLLDAPCTGLGTLRAHPEIRWRRQLADVRRNSVLQRRLLQRAAALTRPGGVVVYATCTLSAEENEQVVDAVCPEAALRVDSVAPYLPAAAAGLADSRGFLRTWPHRDGLDGFFAARLLRHEGASTVAP